MSVLEQLLDGVGSLLSGVMNVMFWGYLKGGGDQSPGQALGSGAQHLAASYLTMIVGVGMVIATVVVVFGVSPADLPLEVIPTP